MFGCCTRTIQRKMRDFGIDSNRFSDIGDLHLDELVSEIVTRLPSCGVRSVQSMLRVNGVILQRERVRASLHRVDPAGMEIRLRRTLHRRQYSVTSPNALWHIDGYCNRLMFEQYDIVLRDRVLYTYNLTLNDLHNYSNQVVC